MFLTETDLINMRITAGAKLNTSKQIEYLINDDEGSNQKRLMSEGERYYVGEHDILNKDFRQTYISETDYEENRENIIKFRNPNRSNHHNVNAFHKILVDQKVSYIVGREPTISVRGAEENKDLKEYEKILTDFADSNFNELIQDWVTGASNKGFEAVHIYYDENGTLRHCISPANEIIPIYDTEHENDLLQLIRYYNITVVEDGRKYLRKKVEWWTKEDVTYYIETDKNKYILDNSYAYNPSPHWWSITNLNGFEKTRVQHSFGRVPFIILKNNRKMTTDLQTIKGLIDAYDLISSEGTNDFLDLVSLYWAIQGYGGETASAIAKKLQINKAVNVSGGEGGRIEAKQVDIPVNGRKEFLNMLRRDIFHFGMGIDVDAEKFGNAPSGVSLKFQYTLIDLKVGNMTAKLKKAIKELLTYVTEDYNRKNNTSYDSSLIEISINKTMITNDTELVSMIQNSKGIVSDKTLLAKHPFVDDVNAELAEIEAQRKKEQALWEGHQEGDINVEEK